MSSQTILGGVRNNERRDTGKFVELRNGFAEIFLSQKVDIELIIGFENSVQCFLYADGCFFRLAQPFHQLGQFRSSRHTYFVPVKIVFLELGKCVIRRVVG